MIFHLGLLELKLHQFVDLQNLAERDEEAVLLDFAVAQNDFALSGERIAVGGFSGGFEEALNVALNHSGSVHPRWS